MRIGIGVGVDSLAMSGAETIALGAGIWQDGVYLDVPMLNLADGASLSSNIVPQVGSVELVPVNTPTVDGVGIGGRSAIFCSASASELLTAHALSSLASGTDLPLTVIARVKRDWPLSARAVFGFGSSASATENFLFGDFPGGAGNSPSFAKDATGEATKTITRTGSMDYADHVVAFVTDGSTGWIYLDGVEVATGDLNTLAVSPNRFGICGRFSTAGTEHLGGWLSHFAMTGQALNATQIASVTSAWRSRDLYCPGASVGTKVQFFGDSITQGDSDTYATSSTRGGFRYDLYEWFRENRYRINLVGHRSQGIFADPEHSAIGGADTTLIRSYINTYIETHTPVAIFVMAGTNDSDAIEAATLSMATWRANYDGMLSDARSKLDTYGGGGRIIVANLIPIQTGTAGATVIGNMNTELVDAWNDHDAANPTKTLIRCDYHTAIGGAYDAAKYKDAVHPNEVGYRLLGTELITQAGSYLASIAA